MKLHGSPVKNRIACFVLGLVFLGAVGGGQAADYYLNPQGAGARNGGSWEDTFAFASINDILNRTMKPGDTLHVEGATYGRVQIIIDSSGSRGAPKRIVGE